MKNKIVGIVICMLLISSTTTLALTPFRKNEQQMKNQFFDRIPVPLPTPKGWMKTFGGDSTDGGYSVQQTSDGGYIIAGETFSFGAGNGDIWVIKTDSIGNKLWYKTFGGSDWDYPSDVKQTNDKGFIITGRTYSFGAGKDDVWVIKLNETGTIQWNKTFGEKFYDFGLESQQTIDGGYIIVGGINLYEPLLFDAWLIKIDSEGNEQWNRTFGEPQQEDYGYSVQQTSDGGYIIAGGTGSYGTTKNSSAFWLIKTDVQGYEQWNRTYGGTWYYGEAFSVELTSDGGYIVIGCKYPYESSQRHIWVIKTDQYGDEQWNKTYGGIKNDYGIEAYQTSDRGYIMIGATESYGAGETDVWMMKIDAYGDEQWNRTYGGKYYDAGASVDQTDDGGYIITGYKGSFIKNNYTSDVWLIKTDSQGKSKTMLSINFWFERLFQRFPNVFPLLRHLMGY
jgi:hypothetical protein